MDEVGISMDNRGQFDPTWSRSWLKKCSCHGSWIVNTGFFYHMTHDLKSFKIIKPLDILIHINLPDGSLKPITHAGQVQPCPHLVLHNVIYMPDFKFSLLSVHGLLNDHRLSALITPEKCTFQDPTTNLPVAVAHVDKGVYKLNSVE